MKKELRNFIERLNIELTRQDGEYALAVTSRPTNQEVAFLKANKQELIEELREINKEKFAKENEERESLNIVIENQSENILPRYVVTQNEKKAEELGIAKRTGTYGYVVEKEIIEALGNEFTAAEARRYLESLKEEKEEVSKEEKMKTLIQTAKVLGHKVEIESYPVACDGSVEECDTDIITRYVDGKGNISTSRMHTH